MQNFIVLGYIPGTQIQINFFGWLIAFMTFCLVVVTVLKLQSFITWLVARRLLHYIENQPIANLAL